MKPLIDHDSYVIRPFSTGSVPVVTHTGLLPSRKDVQALKSACEFLLANLSAKDIEEINARQEQLRKSLEPQTPRRQRHRIGFVYMMLNRRNGLVKIGWASNPRVREKTLQSEEPEVELLASWPGTIADERCLHDKFMAERVRGEWFRISSESLNETILEAMPPP